MFGARLMEAFMKLQPKQVPIRDVPWQTMHTAQLWRPLCAMPSSESLHWMQDLACSYFRMTSRSGCSRASWPRDSLANALSPVGLSICQSKTKVWAPSASIVLPDAFRHVQVTELDCLGASLIDNNRPSDPAPTIPRRGPFSQP